MEKKEEMEEKRFPPFHQFELPSGGKVAINCAYSIPANEENVSDVVPFVLLGNPTPIETQRLVGTVCIDLFKSFPFLKELEDRIGGAFAIEDISIKLKLIDMMFDNEWIKSRMKKTTKFPVDKIPNVNTIIAVLKWGLEKVHSKIWGFSKEDQEALDRFDQQTRLLYYFLIQKNRVLIIFWKNYHPTIHIVLDKNKETKESLAFYFYTQGKGVGKPSNFLWEKLQDAKKSKR